jgi:SAM-dependent methyltransferase
MFEYNFSKSGVRWSGSQFIPTAIIPNLFDFSSNIQGWNDDLTLMHEEVTSGNHPIDVVSRAITLSSLATINSYIKDKVVLEIGSSSGYLIDDLINKTSLNIIGSDIVNQPLLRLAVFYPAVPFVRCDINENPFECGTLGCVISLNVLEHIEDDLKALQNIYSILYEEGYLILEIPFGADLYDDFDRQLSHFRRYSSADIIQKAKVAGFEIINVDYVGILVFPIFYIYKKYITKFKKSKPENLINNSSGLFFGLLLKIERFFCLSKFFHFGIRIRLILRK